MPITGIKSAEGIDSQNAMQSLTVDEQRQLAMALEQMKARGLKLPTHEQIVKPYGHWSIGANGFFIKTNGTEYEPNEKQGKFIASVAARVAMFGGRGFCQAIQLFRLTARRKAGV